MALDYYIYNANNGELISDTRYCGLPFLYEEATKWIHECVIRKNKNNYFKIEKWTIDPESNLYKEEMSKPLWERNDIYAIYCSKTDVLELQKLMTCNKTILQELMEEHECDGIIVEIF